MTELVKKWLGEQYTTIYERVITVADIITDYFGEELVDVKLDMANVIDALFSTKSLESVVTVTDATEDNVFLQGMRIPTDKDKWEKDRCKRFTDLTDTYYFDAIKRKVNLILTNYISAEPVEVLIRFPKVTVTNEYDKSIDITELYTRILISYDGRMYDVFRMMRAEYTVAQFVCNYAHSHLPGSYLEWMQPCLGTGPIASTQSRLMHHFDKELWGLFCYELSKYVTVESISGVPYVRLESVGNRRGRTEFFPYIGGDLGFYRGPVVDNFIKYFIRTQPFNVAFSNGVFTLGEDAIDFLIRISKCFSLWYNKKYKLGIYNMDLQDLLSQNTLRRYTIVGKQLCSIDSDSRRRDVPNMQGYELFIFKGDIVRLNFTDMEGVEEDNTLILLNASIVSAVLTKLLRIINYVYGNQDKENTKEGKQVTAAKKVCFL